MLVPGLPDDAHPAARDHPDEAIAAGEEDLRRVHWHPFVVD
jgi:hypothetical protein